MNGETSALSRVSCGVPLVRVRTSALLKHLNDCEYHQEGVAMRTTSLVRKRTSGTRIRVGTEY